MKNTLQRYDKKLNYQTFLPLFFKFNKYLTIGRFYNALWSHADVKTPIESIELKLQDFNWNMFNLGQKKRATAVAPLLTLNLIL